MVKAMKELIDIRFDFSGGARLTKNGIKELMSSLSQLQNIRSLILGFCDHPLTDIGANIISQAVMKLDKLTTFSLFLQNAGISEVGVSYIMNTVEHLKKLSSLSLNLAQ